MRVKNNVVKRILSNHSLFKRLVSRKPMGLVQIETDTSNQLRRSVTSFQMIAIAVGCIIGMSI